MDKATELFEKYWKLKTGKELDETTKVHMNYCIDAINEALNLSNIVCKICEEETKLTCCSKCYEDLY